MNMKPQKPLADQQPAQAKISLQDAETIKCEQCGNTLFIQSYVLKRISAIVSPSGKEEIITIPMFSCGSCGNVAKEMMKALKEK